jgi:uncharacterized membrane protein YheB (UPF0754 family)
MIDTAYLVALLPWILPPLLGAVIGYLTNALAIRMLFRPLREYRFLGIRVPFTPGVIPRQRVDLAESIGRMVSRELLTEDVFSARFGSDSFRQSLQPVVVGAVDHLAGTTVSSLRSTLAIDSILTMAATLITEERIEDLTRGIAESISRRDRHSSRSLVALAGDVRPLERIDAERLRSIMAEVWPVVQEGVDRVLHTPAVQAEMAVRARRILHYSLDQLSSLQRLFVSAAQYDRQLESRIPAIVSRSTAEILQALESPGTRAHAVASILDWVEKNRSKRLGDLIGSAGMDLLAAELDALLDDPGRVRTGLSGVLDAIFGDRARVHERIVSWTRQLLDENGERTLGEVIPFLTRRRATIAREASYGVQDVLRRITATFLGQLDIHTVVVDRINDLDIEQVEGLLLGIIRRHLRWINLFGALLGAIIGAVQIVLRVIGIV